MSGEAEREAQRERARGTWALWVLEAPGAPGLERLRRLLRYKRFERDALARRLPGVVRRGARVDLEPVCAALRAAGLRAELRRSGEGPGEPEASR